MIKRLRLEKNKNKNESPSMMKVEMRGKIS